MSERETGIALLIDGENIGASSAERIIRALRSFGRIRIGNVYLDLLRPQSSEWCRRLPLLPLEPLMTAVSETGRNSSDISLLIDAVKILHTSDIGIFCICSSDGDFTGLARYLRSRGKSVIIVGDACKAPVSLRVSCDRFIHIRELGDFAENGQEFLNSGHPACDSPEEDPAESGDRALPEGEISSPAAGELPPAAAVSAEAHSDRIPGSGENAGTGASDSGALRLMADYAAGIVLELLRKSGTEGMETSRLQQMLRKRLPGFSVRKLGFRRFADFLGTVGGVRVASLGDGGAGMSVAAAAQ